MHTILPTSTNAYYLLSTGKQTIHQGTFANVWKDKCKSLDFPFCIVLFIELFLIIWKKSHSHGD